MGIPKSCAGDTADSKIKCFIDQRVWPPLTWFDFALTPDLLETHLVAKENVFSGDGGREIISALLHVTVNQTKLSRGHGSSRLSGVDFLATERSSNLFHLASVAAKCCKASLCQLEKIPGFNQILLHALVCGTKSAQTYLQPFDVQRWRLRRYLEPPDFYLGTLVAFQLGEALYTTYTKDHGCDWSTASKLACHAGNISKKSTILVGVVKHELWATVLIELGEWMLCCYDVREVLNCLQVCERLVTMISLPVVLPWTPPGSVRAVYSGSSGVQNCSSIVCRLSSLLAVLHCSNFLLGLRNSVLDVSRSVADLPVLSCSTWKYMNMFFCTICEFPSRYGYVRALVSSGVIGLLKVELVYTILFGALKYREQVMQMLQCCHPESLCEDYATDLYLLLHLLQFGAITIMDMRQCVYLDFFPSSTHHESSVLQFIRIYLGIHCVARHSAAEIYDLAPGLKRNMAVCRSLNILRNCYGSATPEMLTLLAVVEARRRIYLPDQDYHFQLAVHCVMCGQIRCNCEKTKRWVRSHCYVKLAKRNNPHTVAVFSSQVNAASGLLGSHLCKIIKQANWACQSKALSLQNVFSHHSWCTVPCFTCLGVVNLVSRPPMNVYNNSQATHRVVQASEFRRFRLLANLMDLNIGLL